MNISELEKFKIEDAINFHDELNPLLFDENNKLKSNIKSQLDIIVDDFVEYMGLPDLAVEDVIITGSNVAFTYTPHSDIDLHLLVDFSALPESDVYKELFMAKKSLYNDTYEITIRDIPVELYVQDTAQAHTSLGEYSLYQDKFTRIPSKKRANLDEISAEHKFERLEQLAIEGLKSEDIDKVNEVLSIIKRYRQAGLDNKGEFGPENLAFKAIRSKGYFQALFDLRHKLRGKQLSIEEELLRRTFEESIGVYNSKVNLAEDISTEELASQWNVSTREIAKAIDLGVKVEMKNNPQVTATTPQMRRDQATKIAVNNIAKDIDYYEKFITFMRAIAKLNKSSTNDGEGSDVNDISKMGDTYNVSEASGYIPDKLDEIDFKRAAKIGILTALLGTGVSNAVLNQLPDQIVTPSSMSNDPDLRSYSKTYTDDGGYYKKWPDGQPLPVYKHRALELAHQMGIIKDPGNAEIQFKSIAGVPVEINGIEVPQFLLTDKEIEKIATVREIRDSMRGNIDEASGYIPSEAERNDPRFSRALSVDVHPDTMKKGAKAMGLGNISRAGVPPLLRPGKKKNTNSKTQFGKGIY